MDPDPSIVAALLGCLIVVFIASAADAAFTSMSWRRIGALFAEITARSPRLEDLLSRPEQIKASINFFSHTALLIGAVLAANSIGSQLWLYGVLAGSTLLAVLLPRVLVARNPQWWLLHMLLPVRLMTVMLKPMLGLVFAGRSRRSMPEGDEQASLHSNEFNDLSEELRALVSGATEAAYDADQEELPEELRLLSSIAALRETEVREIMIPRVDIVALEVESSFEEALQIVIEEQHSRIPVYEETIDNIVGILYAKDLLPRLQTGQRTCALRDLMRKVYFVPENVNIHSLLKDMQRSKVHLAIIRDEYGGTSGLVTIEDLLEEIVGEINDEYDDEPEVLPLSPTELVVHANVPLDDLNDIITLRLESDDADRIGGLIYTQIGRVPQVNERIELEWAFITVLSGEKRRPEKFHIELRGGERLRDAPQVEPVLEPGTPEQPATEPHEQPAEQQPHDRSMQHTPDVLLPQVAVPEAQIIGLHPDSPTHRMGGYATTSNGSNGNGHAPTSQF